MAAMARSGGVAAMAAILHGGIGVSEHWRVAASVAVSMAAYEHVWLWRRLNIWYLMYVYNTP